MELDLKVENSTENYITVANNSFITTTKLQKNKCFAKKPLFVLKSKDIINDLAALEHIIELRRPKGYATRAQRLRLMLHLVWRNSFNQHEIKILIEGKWAPIF